MEDVLWHSATSRFSKSILVKMPRLPTIRVIGSQFISTRFPFLPGISFVGAVIVLIRSLLFVFSVEISQLTLNLIRSWMVPGAQFRARMTPLGLFVDGGLSHGAQGANRAAIGSNGGGGGLPPQWLI